MTSPAFATIGASIEGTSATANVPVPASVASGDILVVSLFISGDTVTVTGLPSGFAHAGDSPLNINHGGSGNKGTLNIMWKRATAADTGTYDFTLSASAFRNAVCARYTGAVSLGNPWDVTDSADSAGANVTAMPAVSGTTTVADTLLVYTAQNSGGGTYTPPTGFTERDETDFGLMEIADLAQAAAGATGSISATCTASDKSGAWFGALKSVEAAAGRVPVTVSSRSTYF